MDRPVAKTSNHSYLDFKLLYIPPASYSPAVEAKKEVSSFNPFVNPFVPLGIAATLFSLVYGVYQSFVVKNTRMGLRLMDARVGFQFFTIVNIGIAALYWQHNEKKKAEKELEESKDVQ